MDWTKFKEHLIYPIITGIISSICFFVGYNFLKNLKNVDVTINNPELLVLGVSLFLGVVSFIITILTLYHSYKLKRTIQVLPDLLSDIASLSELKPPITSETTPFRLPGPGEPETIEEERALFTGETVVKNENQKHIIDFSNFINYKDVLIQYKVVINTKTKEHSNPDISSCPFCPVCEYSMPVLPSKIYESGKIFFCQRCQRHYKYIDFDKEHEQIRAAVFKDIQEEMFK